MIGFINISIQVSTDIKFLIGQNFHKLRVFHWPKGNLLLCLMHDSCKYDFTE